MEKYKNFRGDSGVSSYQIGFDYIQVMFINGGVYTYSHLKAAKAHIDQMKILAEKGVGLNSYINKYVKNLYD